MWRKLRMTHAQEKKVVDPAETVNEAIKIGAKIAFLYQPSLQWQRNVSIKFTT